MFMKQFGLVILLTIFSFSCVKKKDKTISRNIQKVEFQTHILDSTLSIRALEITDQDKVFFLTSNGFGGSIYYSEYDKNYPELLYDQLQHH